MICLYLCHVLTIFVLVDAGKELELGLALNFVRCVLVLSFLLAGIISILTLFLVSD